VFGVGVWYLLRLIGADPDEAERAFIPPETRAAGITPIQAMRGPTAGMER
jgi:hypothetical protein